MSDLCCLKDEKTDDLAHECFDYLNNIHKTHEMMKEAKGLLERRAKRYGRTVEQELKYFISEGIVRFTETKWFRVIKEAIREAKKDYEKNFPEEFASEKNRPAWLNQTAGEGGSAVPVMTVVMKHLEV